MSVLQCKCVERSKKAQYFTLPHTFRADPSRIRLNPTKFRPYSYLVIKKVYQSHSESFRVHSEFIPSHSDQLMVSKKKLFYQVKMQNSDQILTKFRVNSGSIPSPFRPNSESIPTKF